MHRNVFHGSPDRPPWVRCGAPDVIIARKMPMTGAFGQPLVQFFQGGGRGESRAAEAAELLFA